MIVDQPELPAKASVLIIGGGIQGLSCAFNLAEAGIREVVVLDAGYWQGGASGRNGTLIRAGFLTPEWTRLFHASYEHWLGLSKRLRHNVMFSPRSYTVIAEQDATAAMFEDALPVHREVGVRSEILGRQALKEHLPAIAHQRVKAALRLFDGGVAPHHAVMKGYLAACRERGVAIHYRRAVTGVEMTGGHISAAFVGHHRVAADALVVAAGASNSALATQMGASLAGYPMRIEAMALEPVRPLIGPALSLQDRLCYLHQTARGEVVGGAEVAERPHNTLRSDSPTMAATAAAYLAMFPRLGEVRILRHWAGIIHVSPDFGPMIGRHPALDNVWFSAGWSYGFTGAPGAGALLAAAIARGTIDDRIRPFAVDRFERGQPIAEAAINLAPPGEMSGDIRTSATRDVVDRTLGAQQNEFDNE
jgi:sarcosine oxidase subunit beta